MRTEIRRLSNALDLKWEHRTQIFLAALAMHMPANNLQNHPQVLDFRATNRFSWVGKFQSTELVNNEGSTI